MKDILHYLNLSSELFIILNKDQKVEFVNQKTCNILGYKEEEIIGKNWFDNFIPENSRQEIKAVFSRIISGENDLDEYYENIILNKNKEERLIRWHNNVIRNESGNIEATISFGQDITDTQHTDEVILDLEKRYCELIKTMHDFVAEIDLKGNYQYVNQSFLKATGYENKDVIGKNFFSFLHPDDIETIMSHCHSVQETKKPIYNCEYRFRKKDGNYLYLLTNGDPLFDSKGNLKSIMQVSFDISDRKKTEEALIISQKEKDLILSNLSELVTYQDPQLRIIWANKAAADSVKMAPEDLIGKHCYELWHKSKKPCVDCPIVKARDTGKPQVKEMIFKDDTRWIIHGQPIKDDSGNVIGIVETTQNITNFRNTQEQLLKTNKELVKSHKRLKELTLKDYQTGLYNHLYLADIIEAEFCRARRHGNSLSAIMLDIDYFKSINDVYGFKFGDLVLKQFAKQLKRMVRRYDIVVRFGGEEFIIISAGMDRSEALFLSRRILDAINLYNFGDKKQSVKLKVSIAVASCPEDKVVKGMDLIEKTEHILNEVKEYGGNNVYSSLDIKNKKAPVKLSKAETKEDISLLKKRIDKLTKRSNQNLIEAVFAFAKTIEVKDHYTGEHGEHIVYYATEMARELNLPKPEIENIKQAAILHDLGKVGISETILRKKAKLTQQEFDEIKKHPQIGVDIIRPIQFLHGIIPFILYHHERWDGKGYPSGLKGEEIPMGARIISVADVFHALTSNRPYRKAYGKEEALKIIKEGSGSQFDPRVVNVFLKIIKKNKPKQK